MLRACLLSEILVYLSIRGKQICVPYIPHIALDFVAFYALRTRNLSNVSYNRLCEAAICFHGERVLKS